MNSGTLRQYRYFEALARHRHFGRAADACAISQPALSMQIRELEETLGAPLLERGGRKVELTAFGVEAARRVGDILRAVDDFGDLARASGDDLGGRLTIGVIPTIGPYLLPTVLRVLADASPALDLRFRETQTQRLIDALAERRLDAAIVALPISEPAFVERPLFDEAFVLARPPQDADAPPPSVDGLKTMRLLLLEEGHCFRDQALAVCEAQGGAPREILDASSLSTLVQMVAAGFGVTLLPEMALSVETRAAQVAITRFPPPEPRRGVGLIWRKTNPLGPQLERIADVLRAAFGARA